MDPVGLVQFGFPAHALQQKRDQVSVTGGSKGGIEFLELGRVLGTEIGGHLHARDDDLRRGVSFAHAIDDLLKVRPRHFEGQPAEAVVAAKFENENRNGPLQNPIDATQATGGGVAA